MEGTVMGVFFERSLLLVIVLLSCLCVWRASARPVIPVKKIYHHRAITDTGIEWGSCVVYGTGLVKGSVTETFRTIGDNEEHIFFIPWASVSTSECKQMMQSSNNSSDSIRYSLTIEDVKKPEMGLVFRFIYPKNACTIACKHFDSIQREHGVVFNVYNKSLVHNLKKRQEPVLRTAALKAPPIIFFISGHGGSDVGAVAASGVMEKDICLAVSLELKKILLQEGYTVCLSRTTDETVPLDTRTYKAHRYSADLLVSLHASSAPNKDTAGIELFF